MPKASISVLVVSFVGAIVGNVISAFIKTNKKVVTLVFTPRVGQVPMAMMWRIPRRFLVRCARLQNSTRR